MSGVHTDLLIGAGWLILGENWAKEVECSIGVSEISILKSFFSSSGYKPGRVDDDQTFIFGWDQGEDVTNLCQGGDGTAEMFDMSIGNFKLHFSESFDC